MCESQQCLFPLDAADVDDYCAQTTQTGERVRAPKAARPKAADELRRLEGLLLTPELSASAGPPLSPALAPLSQGSPALAPLSQPSQEQAQNTLDDFELR